MNLIAGSQHLLQGLLARFFGKTQIIRDKGRETQYTEKISSLHMVNK